MVGSGFRYCAIAAVPLFLLVVDEGIAVAVGPLDHFGAGNLARTAFTAQLPDDLHLMAPSQDVRLRQQPSVGVHRQLAAQLDTSVLREVRRFSGFAESETLQRDP